MFNIKFSDVFFVVFSRLIKNFNLDLGTNTPHFDCLVITARNKQIRQTLTAVNLVYNIAVTLVNVAFHSTAWYLVEQLSGASLEDVDARIFTSGLPTPKNKARVNACKSWRQDVLVCLRIRVVIPRDALWVWCDP